MGSRSKSNIVFGSYEQLNGTTGGCELQLKVTRGYLVTQFVWPSLFFPTNKGVIMQCPKCQSEEIEQIDFSAETGLNIVECQQCLYSQTIDQFQAD